MDGMDNKTVNQQKLLSKLGINLPDFIYIVLSQSLEKKKLRTLVDSNQVISGAVTGNLRTLGTSAWSPELKYSRIILEISFLEGIGFLLAEFKRQKSSKIKENTLTGANSWNQQ